MKRTLFILLLLPMLAMAADSPFDGTWKIDISSAQLPDKPEIWVLQNGMYQNNTSTPKINVKADGTDQPTGAKDYDTLAVKVANDKTVEFTAKKAGKAVFSSKGTVSADGTMLTDEFTEYPLASKQPVTGKYMFTRVAAGPSGSHAISGTWRIQRAGNISANALTATMKTTPNGLMLATPLGESFDARFDGKDYPMKGVAPGTMVSLTKMNDRSIIMTEKRDGKITTVTHITVSADGKTCAIKAENKEQGTTAMYTSIKQ